MTKEVKQTILNALNQARGDDLWRAEAAFAGQDLSRACGRSGKTKKEILEYYRAHDRLISDAVRAVEML